MSELKLKPCPFCGSKDWLVVTRPTSGFTWFRFVKCAACRAAGPETQTDVDAEWEWNHRVKEEE